MTDPFAITVPIESLLQLLAASIIVKLTPGPGVTATVARSMAQGLRPALAFVSGVAMADVSLVLLVLLGLAAVASQFEGVMTVVRYLAAGYFIYLGVRFWMADATPGEIKLHSRGDLMKAAVSGYTLTMSNPKAIVFYGALLPLFIDIAALTLADAMLVTALMFADIAVILTGYAVLASRARGLLGSARRIKWFNRAAGTAMIGAGGVVASQ